MQEAISSNFKTSVEKVKVRKVPSLLKRARTTSSSPLHTKLRPATEMSPESAQFFETVTQKYRESVEQIMDTAETFFLQEF